jgi:Tfp pilus assembly protein PilW
VKHWKRTPLTLCASLLVLGTLSSAAAFAADQTVAIDPATGKLRPVEHDDKIIPDTTAQRQAFGAAAKPASPLLQRMTEQATSARTQQQASGAKSAMVNPKRYSYATATRNADGSLSSHCVQGEDAATHALHVQAAKNLLKKGGADVE